MTSISNSRTEMSAFSPFLQQASEVLSSSEKLLRTKLTNSLGLISFLWAFPHLDAFTYRNKTSSLICFPLIPLFNPWILEISLR